MPSSCDGFLVVGDDGGEPDAAAAAAAAPDGVTVVVGAIHHRSPAVKHQSHKPLITSAKEPWA